MWRDPAPRLLKPLMARISALGRYWLFSVFQQSSFPSLCRIAQLGLPPVAMSA